MYSETFRSRKQKLICLQKVDQVTELWLLQKWMSTSVGGVNSVTLDLLTICQVSFPSIGATFLLAWLQFSSDAG